MCCHIWVLGTYATPIHTVCTQAHNPSSYQLYIGALLYALYIRQHYPIIICTVYGYILHMNIHKTLLLSSSYHCTTVCSHARMHAYQPVMSQLHILYIRTYVRIYIYVLYGVSDPPCTCACKIVSSFSALLDNSLLNLANPSQTIYTLLPGTTPSPGVYDEFYSSCTNICTNFRSRNIYTATYSV